MPRESDNFLPNKRYKNTKSGSLRRKIIAAIIVGLIIAIGIFVYVKYWKKDNGTTSTDNVIINNGATSAGINATKEIIKSSAKKAKNKDETTESSATNFNYKTNSYVGYETSEDSTDNSQFEKSTENIEEIESFDSKTPNLLAVEGPDYDDESPSNINEEISLFARHKNYINFPHKNNILKRADTRIQHGEKAELFEFPWMVAMVSRNLLTNSELYYCGASLVSEHLILTAAHCLMIEENLEILIVLGEYNTTTDPDCVTIEDIEECADEIQKIFPSNFTITPHPNYSNITGANDIAIIKLNSPAKLSKSISPILLPWNNPNITEELQIIGFGKTHRWWEGSPSEVLMKASVRVVDNENCINAYETTDNSFQIWEKNFCAKDLRHYKEINSTFMIGTCEGDSGSSIFENSNKRSKIIQYGITSWGDSNKCGFKNRPGVFTKVYDYLDWILDHS